MPKWKTINDVGWSTQQPTTKNEETERHEEEEEDLASYKNNLKLAILNSLSKQNRPSRAKQSKIDFNDDKGKVKYRMPTGMTQEPPCVRGQPVALKRMKKKRKTESDNKKMAASMHGFLKKAPPNAKKEGNSASHQNLVTPVKPISKTTIDLSHGSDNNKARQSGNTDDGQTSNKGSEGTNEQSGNDFLRFEGMIKVCVVCNTPAGSEVWLNPEAIREFTARFENP